jgi:hypothetical protein
MASLKYAKPVKLSLKDHPKFNERWLQDRIVEDSSLLGLGISCSTRLRRPAHGLI